jgi:hypothetical protein
MEPWSDFSVGQVHTHGGSMPSRFTRALAGANLVFDHPREIVQAADLSRDQKIKLLEEWDYDLRLKMVATEENMPSGGEDEGTSADLTIAVR